MITLQKQIHLCKILNIIESTAFALGYELVREDAYRDPRVHGKFGKRGSYAASHSVHKVKCAQDYSLFKDSEYLDDARADELFNKLHDIGDLLGLAKRIKGDLGHFSMEYQGYR